MIGSPVHHWNEADVEAARLLAVASPEACAREIDRADALPPAPPPPWAGCPRRATRVRQALVELDIAGGFVKPDPLTHNDLLAAPDFHTEARREGIIPERIEREAVL